MFANEIRRVIEAAPRVKLADIGAAMRKARAAGQVTDDQAEELSALIEARKVISAPEKPVQRREHRTWPKHIQIRIDGGRVTAARTPDASLQ